MIFFVVRGWLKAFPLERIGTGIFVECLGKRSKEQSDIMVYIASDGSLADTKKRKWGLSIIRDFIVGIFDFIGLFFRTLTASPTTLENERVSVSCFCCCIHYMLSLCILHNLYGV